MPTFQEANQARTVLKMKLSIHSWYKNSAVCSTSDGWGVVITVKKLDNKVRKIISPVYNNIAVKTEVD